MIKALLEGVLLGLTLAILIGPAFFALIQTSIKYGFNSGVALAFGIFFSDILCVFLAYLGASQLVDNPSGKFLIGVSGGIILILLGSINMVQKYVPEKDMEIKAAYSSLMILKGFFLNLLNPFTLIFWLGSTSIVSSRFEFKKTEIILFFLGTLFTVLSTDVLKAFVALKIRSFLKPELLVKINRIAGIILVIFGVSLIYRVIS